MQLILSNGNDTRLYKKCYKYSVMDVFVEQQYLRNHFEIPTEVYKDYSI